MENNLSKSRTRKNLDNTICAYIFAKGELFLGKWCFHHTFENKYWNYKWFCSFFLSKYSSSSLKNTCKSSWQRNLIGKVETFNIVLVIILQRFDRYSARKLLSFKKEGFKYLMQVSNKLNSIKSKKMPIKRELRY